MQKMGGYSAASQSSNHHSNDLNLLWQVRWAVFGQGVFVGASSIQHVAEFETVFTSDTIPRIVATAIPFAESG
jgi:hypothetical protein